MSSMTGGMYGGGPGVGSTGGLYYDPTSAYGYGGAPPTSGLGYNPFSSFKPSPAQMGPMSSVPNAFGQQGQGGGIPATLPPMSPPMAGGGAPGQNPMQMIMQMLLGGGAPGGMRGGY